MHCLPVGNAGNITAYWKGYVEYEADGIVKGRPRMLGWQAAGAAPLVHGEPVPHPETIATAIRIGNPASWDGAITARDESGGAIESVTDAEILAAYRMLASLEGVFVEPASASSVAGLLKGAAAGLVEPGEIVVCTVTGHGLKDPNRAIAEVETGEVVDADVDRRARRIGVCDGRRLHWSPAHRPESGPSSRRSSRRRASVSCSSRVTKRGSRRSRRSSARGIGVATEVLVADLTDPAQLAKVEARLADRDRPIDVLVNNAGFGTNGRLHELDRDTETREVNLNVVALVRLTHAALGPMVERGSGGVLNVSSLAGMQPTPGNATYGATKAFVSSFTQSVHEELRGTGVKVTVVCPGFTRTEFQVRAGHRLEQGARVPLAECRRGRGRRARRARAEPRRLRAGNPQPRSPPVS